MWTGPTTTITTTTTTTATTRFTSPPGATAAPPAGAAVLAQMVVAMQAAAAAFAPGPGVPAPPPRVKILPLIFKGLPGERPEAHLMRANDWMDTYNILPVNKPTNFKHTLNQLAREWYDSLTFLIAWNELQQGSADISLPRDNP